MTRDEIVEMAKEVGLGFVVDRHWMCHDELEAFAKLVEDKVRQEIIEKNAPVIKKVNDHIKELQDAVKAEREACALIVEETDVVQTTYCMTLHDEGAETLRNAADAIRARGEA